MGERRRLINLACRLLGSLAEAEEARAGDLCPLVRPARGQRILQPGDEVDLRAELAGDRR